MAVPSREVGARYCAPVLTKQEVFWPEGVGRLGERMPAQLSTMGSDGSSPTCRRPTSLRPKSIVALANPASLLATTSVSKKNLETLVVDKRFAPVLE